MPVSLQGGKSDNAQCCVLCTMYLCINSCLCSVVLSSGNAVEKMIDCGAGVVDADCKLKLNDRLLSSSYFIATHLKISSKLFKQ
jgi:hypothetical protein